MDLEQGHEIAHISRGSKNANATVLVISSVLPLKKGVELVLFITPG